MLFRADPHHLPSQPAAADVAASTFDDGDAWPAADAADDVDADADGTALLRLFGAAAMAILALAAASIVLV